MDDSDSNDSLVDRFRSRYLLKLTAIAVVVVIIIGAVGFNAVGSANSQITDQTQSELGRLSDLQSERVQQWVGDLQRQTQLVSQSGEITESIETAGDIDSERIRNYLLNQTSEASNAFGEEVVAIHFVNPAELGGEPQIITSTAEGLAGTDISNYAWRDDFPGVSRQTSISEPYSSPVTGNMTGNQTVAFLTGIEGQANFGIVVVVDTGKTGLLRAPSDQGQAYVTDAEGTIMLSTAQELVGEDAIESGVASESILSMGFGGAQYTGDISIGGEGQATSAAAFDSQSGLEWTVVTQDPKSAAFALSSSIQTTIYVLLGVVVVAFGLFFVLISRGAIADVRDLSEKAAVIANSQGDADVDLETNRRDEIGRLVRSVDQMQRSLNEQISERIEELERLNTRMTSAVDDQSEVMNDCADGDLSRRMDADTGVDQLDDLATSFNDMMDDLQASIEEALSFSYTVASASEEAAAAAGESRQASRRVSEGTQEISHGTDRQSEELGAIVQEMSSFSASIEEVASSSHQLSARSNDAAETAEDGREAAQQAVNQLQTIEAETEEVVESFEALREEADAIEEIVDFISQVAEQTNMLALNANIEASRAGSGEGDEEGFGVVAEEIKDLATETQDAAGDVEERLTAIQERTEETSSNIDDAQASIRQGTETIQDALDALDSIAEAVQDVDVSVQEIDDVVEGQSETAQQVVTRVEEVSDIAEQNAHQAEDVAAAAEEQTVTVDQISSTVDELSDQADQLADLLGRFTVDAQPRNESATLD